LQEPEFLRTLLALVLEFSQPLPQHLLMFRTPSPALLEFRQIDRTDLVGIDEVWQRFAGKWASSWEQRFSMGTPNRRPTGK
jgi:hypothetical protein